MASPNNSNDGGNGDGGGQPNNSNNNNGDSSQPDNNNDDGNNCAAGYSPCLPVVGDLNCDQVTGPITVTGSDPYGLDADNDGVGCE